MWTESGGLKKQDYLKKINHEGHYTWDFIYVYPPRKYRNSNFTSTKKI